ncbi:MAG TPA: SRPBCC family protein [Ornithinimicrobium sp.]|uniref:SRPBCC family protein n=1 Tax=Ornithinimicrobium sp. TaxID=1977084 RepID=UPI002B4AA717|nr:SRPBCC family protein [Ornithinimicrobium sp.]HKJ11130.1 SRPBCC family protein [Ornithinimicrobium sp.]
MTDLTLRLSRTIDAAPAAVWDVLTDLTRSAERLSGVESVQIMTPGPYAVGTRWRQTRSFFGRSSTEEMWVRQNHPLRYTVIESGEGEATFRTVWQLEPIESLDDDGRCPTTSLTVTFTATAGTSALGRAASAVLGPVGLRATRRALHRDLDDIAAAAQDYPRQESHPEGA